jgi:thioredoxin reductase (NADPH)
VDNDGYILTGPGPGSAVAQREPWGTLDRAPYHVETSRPGVFAIGDVRSGSTKIVAPATGDGGMAARFAAECLAPVPVR